MKCRAYLPRTPATPKANTPAAKMKRRRAFVEHNMRQAELIGWPALAESFRRELEALR